MDQTQPIRWMKRALALARRGLGRVEPNPMVGAVLVRGDRVVAEGRHRRFGAPHAEIDAIQQCRDRGVDPTGCDLFVTLEPCSHHGKTPPCVDALVDAGVGRVFVAMVDPNPVVSGAGIDRLRSAGVQVEVGLCQAQAQQLNEAFVKRVTTGRPWVIAKWAQTLDGRIATRTGDSRWISNPESRRLTHRIRGRVDAVMVGIGTVLADDPRLTARGVRPQRMARRVVVDPQLRLPGDARLMDRYVLGPAPPLTIAVSRSMYAARPARLVAMESAGVECVGLPPCSADPSRLALAPLLEHLAAVHLATNVLVEGGSKLVGSLWQQQLVDQVVAFVAPSLLGDADAVPVAQGLMPPPATMDQARRLSLHAIKRLGQDVMLDYRVKPSG